MNRLSYPYIMIPASLGPEKESVYLANSSFLKSLIPCGLGKLESTYVPSYEAMCVFRRYQSLEVKFVVGYGGQLCEMCEKVLHWNDTLAMTAALYVTNRYSIAKHILQKS